MFEPHNLCYEYVYISHPKQHIQKSVCPSKAATKSNDIMLWPCVRYENINQISDNTILLLKY